MSPGGGVEGVGADLDVGAEDDRDDVQELAVRRLLRQPANETKRKMMIGLLRTPNKVNRDRWRCQLQKRKEFARAGLISRATNCQFRRPPSTTIRPFGGKREGEETIDPGPNGGERVSSLFE